MNLKNSFALLTAGVFVLTTAGCTDRTSVNKENFARVITQDYATNGDCLFTRSLAFPYHVGAEDHLLTETRNQLNALTNEGLLTRASSTQGSETLLQFALTETGRKVPGDGRFCYGNRHVTSVDTFSAPAAFRGVQMTHVGYHYTIKDGATWAKAQDVKAAFPSVARSMSDQPVDEATLVLEKEGWALENQ